MNYKDRALAALECPCDWTWLIAETDALQVGVLDWLYWCHEVAVSVDEKMAISDYASNLQVLDTDEFDRAVAINLETERPRAVERYEEHVGRLHKLPFVCPSVQKKHYVAGRSRESVISQSQSGPSYFFRDYTEDELRWAFWQWLIDYYDPTRIVRDVHSQDELQRYSAVIRGEDCLDEVRRQGWLDMRSGAAGRIAFDTREEIGASDGKPTTCICFDVGTANVHAYPVSASQAASLMQPDMLWTSRTLW